MNEEDRLDELKNEAYHAEEVLDGIYTPGMYGDKYPEIDETYTEMLTQLRKMFSVIEKTLRPNKDDDKYQDWLNRHGVTEDVVTKFSDFNEED